MNPIRTIRRLACMLSGLAAALAAAVAVAPAAFATTRVFPPPEPAATPVSPLPTPDWQIALIAVGAAIVGAVVAVLLDRLRAARRHRPATAA
jgi:membrane protein YqaA with SNARE-associated domain